MRPLTTWSWPTTALATSSRTATSAARPAGSAVGAALLVSAAVNVFLPLGLGHQGRGPVPPARRRYSALTRRARHGSAPGRLPIAAPPQGSPSRDPRLPAGRLRGR